MRSSDQPLPGDIMIVERLDTSTFRPNVVYVLRHWPQEVSAGGPYQSFTYARQQAIKLAASSAARVWRVHATRITDAYEYEDVSEDDSDRITATSKRANVIAPQRRPQSKPKRG